MSAAKPPLMKEIEAHLKSSPKQLEKFRSLISDFKSESKTASQVYEQVLLMVDGNQRLTSSIRNATPSGIDQLSQLVQVVQVNLKGQPSLPQFTKALTLFVDELIPMQFFEYYIHQLTSSVKSKSRRDIDSELAKLVKLDDTSFLHRVRQNMSSEDSPDGFILPPDVTPNSLVQLMVMTGLCCNAKNMETVLNALDLYGYVLMTIDGVYHLLNPINEILASTFEDIAQTIPNEAFFPSAIFEQMKKDFKQNQLKWILGDSLYGQLSAWPDNHKSSLVQIAMSLRDETKKREDRNVVPTAPYVVELQAKTMFNGLETMIESLRTDGKVKEPTDVVKALCRDASYERDDTFYGVVFDYCLEVGAKVHKQHMSFLNERLTTLTPSSTDWRVEMKAKLNKNLVIRNLVFVGTKYELQPKLYHCVKFCKKFLAHFQGLKGAMKSVKTLFAGGEFDLDESGALMLHFFGEILEIVREADLELTVLLEIPDAFFVEDAPLKSFEGLAVANADLVLRYFAMYLKKALNCPQQFVADSAVVVQGCFAYHASIKGGTVTIEGFPNVICV